MTVFGFVVMKPSKVDGGRQKFHFLIAAQLPSMLPILMDVNGVPMAEIIIMLSIIIISV